AVALSICVGHQVLYHFSNDPKKTFCFQTLEYLNSVNCIALVGACAWYGSKTSVISCQ
ncbi:hypothetical protein L9F63_007714, partial [Diploptera punctata]